MPNIHHLKTAVINGMAINYFYTKEKSDRNGNPQFKVYVIDPDAPAVYETIVKCYEVQIKDFVTDYVETALAAC